MITDKSEQRDRRYANMRSIKDYGMGVLYLAVAVIMFFPKKVGLGTLEVDPIVRYIFGSICIIYGAWRLYRGYKKDYFKS
jgi:hypothetical protein